MACGLQVVINGEQHHLPLNMWWAFLAIPHVVFSICQVNGITREDVNKARIVVKVVDGTVY